MQKPTRNEISGDLNAFSANTEAAPAERHLVASSAYEPAVSMAKHNATRSGTHIDPPTSPAIVPATAYTPAPSTSPRMNRNNIGPVTARRKDGLEDAAWLKLESDMGGSGGGVVISNQRARPADAGFFTMENARAAQWKMHALPKFRFPLRIQRSAPSIVVVQVRIGAGQPSRFPTGNPFRLINAAFERVVHGPFRARQLPGAFNHALPRGGVDADQHLNIGVLALTDPDFDMATVFHFLGKALFLEYLFRPSLIGIATNKHNCSPRPLVG
ncbi:hypothetical protein ALP50_200223 [Pseudomonas syringae pv. spinaceae]|nr:hypothetical protein ALP50_200223 [Pseudomonas syringae pv. spinaceae]